MTISAAGLTVDLQTPPPFTFRDNENKIRASETPMAEPHDALQVQGLSFLKMGWRGAMTCHPESEGRLRGRTVHFPRGRDR
jgi:hypothetical protein